MTRYHLNDATYCEYQINSANNKCIFEKVLKLSGGSSADICENEATSLFSICQEFENEELCSLLFDGLIATLR
jgi:hypothetical protein